MHPTLTMRISAHSLTRVFRLEAYWRPPADQSVNGLSSNARARRSAPRHRPRSLRRLTSGSDYGIPPLMTKLPVSASKISTPRL
jgi:hypothetical protein